MILRTASIAIALLLIEGTVIASSAVPQDAEARAHFDRGLEAYRARAYEQAIAELSACWRIEPHRACLFAWAQAERLAGRCVEAIGLYRRFLGLEPPKEEADRARLGLARCVERGPIDQIPTSTASSSAESLEPTAARATPEAETPPPARTSWFSDPWADALFIGGVASVGAGTGFYVASNAKSSEAGRAMFYDDFVRLDDAAGRDRTIALAFTSAGIVLLAAAFVEILFLRSD
jgi:hypothetical protein